MNCKNCDSKNLETLQDDYKGEYAVITYQCLDCNYKTTNYYDIKYTNTHAFYKENQKERVA